MDKISFLLFSAYMLKERSNYNCFDVYSFLEVEFFVIRDCKYIFINIFLKPLNVEMYVISRSEALIIEWYENISSTNELGMIPLFDCLPKIYIF